MESNHPTPAQDFDLEKGFRCGRMERDLFFTAEAQRTQSFRRDFFLSHIDYIDT
jgi:hypothetical protein